MSVLVHMEDRANSGHFSAVKDSPRCTEYASNPTAQYGSRYAARTAGQDTSADAAFQGSRYASCDSSIYH